MPCQEKRCLARQFGTGYHYVGGFYGACNEALMRAELVKNGPIVVAFGDSLFCKIFSLLFFFEQEKTVKNFSKKLYTSKIKKKLR